jgi:hypothetical protein
MIKIHNCDEGPSSLLKISLSEKEKKKKKEKKMHVITLSQISLILPFFGFIF